MSGHQAVDAFENPLVAVLVGVAVSLDVMALTFCSSHIYLADRKTWWRWAKYNAGWHAGLLLTYLVIIDLVSVVLQYVGVLVSLDLPDWLVALAPIWRWLAERFRSHIVVYAAIAAMAYVWYQYSNKVRAVPTSPSADQAPVWLRRLFAPHAESLTKTTSPWFWHLSACLVAVDMLALAAVIKSGEKLVQFPKGFDRFEGSLHQLNEKILASFDLSFLSATLLITGAVFVVVGLLCYASAKISRSFWTNRLIHEDEDYAGVVAKFVVIGLKLLEPLVIFYFIIHSMAFLATGVPLHSPAFILGAGFLVAALIEFVGFKKIIEASEEQIATSVDLAKGEGNV